MYTSGWHSSKSRFYIACIGIAGGIFGLVVLSIAFYRQYAADTMSNFDVFCAVCGIGLMIWGIFFAFRPMILQTLHCCFTIEIGATRIVGITIFNKHIDLNYDAIEKIIAFERFSFLRANILLLDRDGHELEIHHNIDHLGLCVEEIRKRCPNLKIVDYKGMDKIPAIWSAGNKHAML